MRDWYMRNCERLVLALEAFNVIAFLLIMAAFGAMVVNGCSTPTGQAKAQKAEADLCAIRAKERALELAGVLPPLAGSLRAQIESAEDALCAARADAAPPD